MFTIRRRIAFWLGHLVTQHMLLSALQGFRQSVPLIFFPRFPSGAWLCALAQNTNLQNVVAWAVAEVPHANLGAHVPATEGAASELQATDLQQHARDRGETVPFQVQVLKPLIPGQSTQGNDVGIPLRSCKFPPLAIYTIIKYTQFVVVFRSRGINPWNTYCKKGVRPKSTLTQINHF